MTVTVPKIFKDPIIAFAIVRLDFVGKELDVKSDLDIIPISVSWDGTEINGDFREILAVYPAQPGTYSVRGYIDDIPEEEIWLGYELPGADIPDWEEVLAATTYEIVDVQDEEGEMHSIIRLDKPSRVDMRIKAMKPKKKKGKTPKIIDRNI
jgi:hypothetical protein